MKILCSTTPPQQLQRHLRDTYPAHQFIFQKDLDETDIHLAESEILITFGDDFTVRHLERARALKWLCCISAGVDKLPLEALAQRAILVTNASGVHSIPMAEYAIGMMLAHVKCFKVQILNQQQSQWNAKLPFEELNGKTLLLLGTGAISKKVSELAAAFAVTVIGVSRSGKQETGYQHVGKIDSLIEMLPQADFIISILPSTKETKNLLKKEHFLAMKSTALFMNLGRGDLFEEQVLINALTEKQVAAAVLDVFHSEPLQPNHPFWQLENLTITPHDSSHSAGYFPRAFAIFEENLGYYLKNEHEKTINLVDHQKGY